MSQVTRGDVPDKAAGRHSPAECWKLDATQPAMASAPLSGPILGLI